MPTASPHRQTVLQTAAAQASCHYHADPMPPHHSRHSFAAHEGAPAIFWISRPELVRHLQDPHIETAGPATLWTPACKASIVYILYPRFHVKMPRAACPPWRQHPRALSFPSVDPHCACTCKARLCARPRTQTAGLSSQKACRPKHFRQARGGLLWTWTWPRRRGGMPTRFRVAGMIRLCCNLSTCPWEPSPGTRRLGL